MKLRGKDIVAYFYFLFLNDEWGIKGYEEGVMMMLSFLKTRRDFDTSLEGKIDVGVGYNIMGE
jgi:hypothetical protein